MPKIIIPYKPREAFKPLHNRSQRWAVVVAHRRAGKTVACINELIKRCIKNTLPLANYAYIAPFYTQAKSIAWSYLKHFTAPIEGIKFNESELAVILPNGAKIRLYGADNADALRGQYFDGIIADEYGDWKPGIWGYILRPALSDRKGWAIFIGTPKGHNEFFDLYSKAQDDMNWFHLKITCPESGLLDSDEVEDMRRELSEDQWRQEMECNFDAALPGAIYGKEMWAVLQSNRIKSGLYDPSLEVHVAMDLGHNDDTCLIFFQIKQKLCIIDSYSSNFNGVQHYSDVMRSKPYKYAHWLWIPHDGMAKTLASPRSTEQQFLELGWHPRKVPNLTINDGINAARLTFVDCEFDEKTQDLRNALTQYQREFDVEKKVFREKPRHDWTSHYADAFRYSCVVWRQELSPQPPKEIRFPQHRTINDLIKRNSRKQEEF